MKMMYLLLATILLGILVLYAAGCSFSAKTTPSVASPAAASASAAKPSASPSAQSTTSALASAAPSTAASPASAASPTASKAPAASASADTGTKDFWAVADALLKSDGMGALRISMPESDVIKDLGQPTSKTDPELWGADGLQHSTWNYDKAGLKLNVTKQPNETTYIIFSITASQPCSLTTQRGIKLGDAKEKVLSVYGDAIDPTAGPDTGKHIVAGTVYGGIIFDISDGVVSRIFIGAAAE